MAASTSSASGGQPGGGSSASDLKRSLSCDSAGGSPRKHRKTGGDGSPATSTTGAARKREYFPGPSKAWALLTQGGPASTANEEKHVAACYRKHGGLAARLQFSLVGCRFNSFCTRVDSDECFHKQHPVEMHMLLYYVAKSSDMR